jgi:hypothetical protein
MATVYDGLNSVGHLGTRARLCGAIFAPGLADVFQPDFGEIIRQDLGETSINIEGETRNCVEATK